MRKLIFILFLFLPCLVHAQQGLDLLTVVDNQNGGQTYTLSIKIFFLMTVLTLLPAALLMMTSFTRIIIVLAILRQALGTAQTPSSQILIGLALFLSFFIMFVLSNISLKSSLLRSKILSKCLGINNLDN